MTSLSTSAVSWRHGLYSAVESGRDIIEWRRRRERPVARKSSRSVLWTVTACVSGRHGHKTTTSMMMMMIMATVLWMRFLSVVDSPSGSGPGGSRASSPEHPEESPGDLCLMQPLHDNCALLICWCCCETNPPVYVVPCNRRVMRSAPPTTIRHHHHNHHHHRLQQFSTDTNNNSPAYNYIRNKCM